MIARRLTCLLLTTALAACGPAAGAATTPAPGTATSTSGVTPGTTTATLTVGGHRRSYRLHVPGSVHGRVPLVVMPHGGFGSAVQAERSYGWDAEADRNGFAVAYPDGLHRTWNGGGCCGYAQRENVDDVSFVLAMVDRIGRRLPIDRSRVFATGMSNGAIMAYRLACETSTFAAVAPVAGTVLVGCRSPHRLSVLHIHGTADTHVPYAGGRGVGPAAVDGPSVPAVNALWRRVDRCRAPVVTTDAPVTTSRASCPRHRVVELISVAGAGHQWPGSVKPQATSGPDAPSTALDATDVIWRFFDALGRRGAVR